MWVAIHGSHMDVGGCALHPLMIHTHTVVELEMKGLVGGFRMREVIRCTIRPLRCSTAPLCGTGSSLVAWLMGGSTGHSVSQSEAASLPS